MPWRPNWGSWRKIPNMAWIIDTDLFVEGERGNPACLHWLQGADLTATADVVRGEFLLGAHAVADARIRQRALKFYADRVARLPSFSTEPADFVKAAALAGEARRQGRGKPGLVDGLLAAIAMRVGATIATRNLKDFTGMGCPCANPLLDLRLE